MTAPKEAFRERARRLCDLSLARLPFFLDDRTGLFAFRADGDAMIRSTTTSVRYTAMTLLGLERAHASGLTSSIDVAKVDAALERALPSVTNSGDVALVLWAALARKNARLAELALESLLDFGDLTRERSGRAYHGTELAWVVTALAEARMQDLGNERAVRVRLDEAYERLLDLRGSSGLIAFSRPASKDGSRFVTAMSARERMKATLGFFDAQVYSILAFLAKSKATNDPIAKVFAKVIGEEILKHQRPLGQWAWHYNVETGSVVDVYPVYSVHQDGMAPMALLPLAEATGLEVEEPIARGVAWLFGDNELETSLVDETRALIFRSIRRKQPFKNVLYPLKALSMANALGSLDLGARLAKREHVHIDKELRPYHLGWCLFAFSEIAAKARRDKHAHDIEAEQVPATARAI